MSTIDALEVAPIAAPVPPVAPARSLLAAWRSATAREAAWFGLLGLALAGLNLTALTATSQPMSLDCPVVVAEMLSPMLHAALLLLAWLPADRSAPDLPRRGLRLALAVVVAATLQALFGPPLMHALGLPASAQEASPMPGKTPPSDLLRIASEMLWGVFASGFAVGVIELRGRRARLDIAVQRALGEHAALAHAALGSRLTAMQAQVEPRFLFDALVDIERRYGSADPAAADQLDRLITYLRVALPRLRDSGSTLGAEADLLQSYASVLDGARPGCARWQVDVPDALRPLTFHPMLLLPLLQRAVRHGGPPTFIGLQARADEQTLRVGLTLSTRGLCSDDDELQRVRERLAALYGARAQLDCVSDGTHTMFALILPMQGQRQGKA